MTTDGGASAEARSATDGGSFRIEPTGARVVAKRGLPLGTRIGAIVAVVLLVAFGSSIAIAYPFVHSSAIELGRGSLSNQADAVARFLDGPDDARDSLISLPTQILEVLAGHQVTAALVPFGAPVVPPMLETDRIFGLRHRAISDVRRDATGQVVWFEYRALSGGYSLFLTQPESISDGPTRALLLRMGYGAVVALVLAMAAVALYTRRATAPIRHAVSAAERMAEGSRDVRLVEGGVAEFADLSRSMNELSDALANSEDRQRQFLLSVSHELRTPLTAIAGYAEALADGVIDGPDIEATGAIMRDEAVRLQRLVTDLLDLSRAGAVELRLDPQRFDLRDVVAGAGQVWRARCEREDVDFRLECPDESVFITSDAVRVRQVIDNLCENALRVTPAQRPLVLALRAAENNAELEVRDGGPGLTEDDRRVAFEPSALHDRYIGIRPVGTGVGLALVGRLAERLGGQASVTAAPEGGACFTVQLPRDWWR